ncbi:hypothetical protein EBR96_09750 [bacterium]|nr:hypothetical protein [bacterium]
MKILNSIIAMSLFVLVGCASKIQVDRLPASVEEPLSKFESQYEIFTYSDPKEECYINLAILGMRLNWFQGPGNYKNAKTAKDFLSAAEVWVNRYLRSRDGSLLGNYNVYRFAGATVKEWDRVGGWSGGFMVQEFYEGHLPKSCEGLVYVPKGLFGTDKLFYKKSNL